MKAPYTSGVPSLAEQLAARAARGFIGALSPSSEPLRRYLAQSLDVPPGNPGGFLAEPVIEAVFDWETTGATMQDLAAQGLLARATVEALAAEDAAKELGEYRFPPTREPYTHQVEAWQHLLAEDPRSAPREQRHRLWKDRSASWSQSWTSLHVRSELAPSRESGRCSCIP